MFRRIIWGLFAGIAFGGAANAQSPVDAEPISERKSGPVQSPSAPASSPVIPASNTQPEDIGPTGYGPPLEAQPSHGPLPPPTPQPDIYDPYFGPRVPKPKPAHDAFHTNGLAWTRLEFLLWSATGQHVPPAITSSPPGTPANFAGIIPNPGTEVLFPRDRTNNEFRGGFRVTSGVWLDDLQEVGLEGDFFFLHNSKKGLTAASDLGGNQILARPFQNALTGVPDAIVVAFPGLSRGVLDVRAENWAAGGGANMLFNMSRDECNSFDFVLGYRYFGVFDEVSIEQDSTALAAQPGVPFATRTQVLDRFNTANHFHGALFGINGERRFGVWFVGSRASVAFGGVKQESIIDGRTVVTPASGLAHATFQGLYAQSTNIGLRERTWFAVLPEVTLRAGVQFSESTRFYFGYNWLYLSSVARAGDQIDTRVNPNLLPGGSGLGPRYPGFQRLIKSDYWLQGMNFGMEIQF